MGSEHVDLNAHYEELKEKGYTVFSDVYSESVRQEWKIKYHRMQDESLGETPTWWFANTLELAPKQMLPAVTNPLILDFAERVMGPFVQLDNLTLAGFPSVSNEEAEGRVSGWHRDRWANVPRSGDYVPPLSVNAISYLQDLTDEYGPLRVIEGSHRVPLTITPEQLKVPHPQEKILHVKAGDVVFTHNGLVHSGTPNTSGKIRYFFSVYYNKSWLKHTDNYNGPNVQGIIREARARNDHRILRLFGVDEQLEKRANSGFLRDDEAAWAEWAEADRKAVRA